jgi:hypothetical protein
MDATDKLIEALVTARESGLEGGEVLNLVADVYAAPWSDTAVRRSRRHFKEQTQPLKHGRRLDAAQVTVRP